MAAHHYISQFHQRLMIDKGDNWFFFDKDRKERGIEERNTKSVFKKNDFYARIDENGVKDFSTEVELSKLENAVAPIFKQLLTDAERGIISPLSEQDHEIWCKYFVTQHRRTIDKYRGSDILNNISDNIDQSFRNIEERLGPIPIEEKIRLKAPKKIQEIKQNVWTEHMLQIEGPALSRVSSMGISLAVAPPKKSFIIGSTPIIRFEDYPQQQLGEPGVEMWMPIGKRVAISPHGSRRTAVLINIDGNSVRKLNESIFKHSSLVASHSLRLLSSLVKSKSSMLTINNVFPG